MYGLWDLKKVDCLGREAEADLHTEDFFKQGGKYSILLTSDQLRTNYPPGGEEPDCHMVIQVY